VFVCNVSGLIGFRYEHRDDVVAQQQEILRREPLRFESVTMDAPESRNRVLMPLLLEASSHVHALAPRQWFVVWRLITAFVALGAVTLLIPPGLAALVAQGLLAYILVLSFNRAWEYPTDFPDVAFTLAMCALTLTRAWWPLLLVACVAAANRESAAFAGVIWMAVQGFRDNRVRPFEVGRGALLAAVTYGVALALRAWFAPPGPHRVQLIAVVYVPTLLREFVRHPNPAAWPVLLAAGVLPLRVLAGVARGTLTPAHRRMVWAGVVVAALTLVFGMIDELRVLLPAAAIVIFANCHALASWTERRTDAVLLAERSAEAGAPPE
jgi:hypothetical protein